MCEKPSATEMRRLTCIYSEEYDLYCERMARAGKGGQIVTAEEFVLQHTRR